MQQITPEHLIELQRNHEEMLLVNTLPQDSFQQTAIHGSLSIPQDDANFVERVKEELDGADIPVVVYCANESCDSSLQAARKLDDAGIKQVLELTEGYEGWCSYLEKEHAVTGG